MRKRTLSFMSIRSVRLTTDWMWNIWFCICIACVSLFSRPNYFPFRLVMMKSAVQIEGMKMGFSKLFEIHIEMLTAIYFGGDVDVCSSRVLRCIRNGKIEIILNVYAWCLLTTAQRYHPSHIFCGILAPDLHIALWASKVPNEQAANIHTDTHHSD